MLQDGQRHGQLRLDTTITIRLLLAAAGKMLSGSLSEERVRQSGREPRCWRWFSVSARRPFNIPIVCISAETERKASSSAHTVASRLLDRRLGETKSVFSKCILRQCVLRAYSASVFCECVLGRVCSVRVYSPSVLSDYILQVNSSTLQRRSPTPFPDSLSLSLLSDRVLSDCILACTHEESAKCSQARTRPAESPRSSNGSVCVCVWPMHRQWPPEKSLRAGAANAQCISLANLL